MERELKKFSVAFDFGNNVIHTECYFVDLDEALYCIRDELRNCGDIATIEELLINPKLLQAVEIREIKEQDDTI